MHHHVIARNEAIANDTGPLCIACDCHAIAYSNDMVIYGAYNVPSVCLGEDHDEYESRYCIVIAAFLYSFIKVDTNLNYK